MVDLNGVDDQAFRKWMRNRHNTHHTNQVDVRRRRSNQSLENMIKKLSGYGFKNRAQYNLSFDTDGYKKGNWFTDEDLATLAFIYDGVGNKGYKHLLIGCGGD